MDELKEMNEQGQDIEELESEDLVQSEDRVTVGNLTEGLNLSEKGSQILENTVKHIFFNKMRNKKFISLLCKLQGVKNGSQQRENSVHLAVFFYIGENASQVAEIVNGVYGADTVTDNYVQF
ncbi:hypothetical protein TNCV_4477591 [Trichonephila clavipes]|nr:hypothetical protein TNCV_4477591 [Trichonephila clavipes]